MAAIDSIYEWIASQPAPHADHPLAAALPRAEDDYFSRLADVLLTRRTEPAWAGLIGSHDRLSPAQRARVWERIDLVRRGAAVAARSSSSTARLNAFTLLAESPFIKLVYLIPDALRDPSHPVRDKAAQAFRQMAECFLSHTMPPRDGVAWRKSLDPDQREFLNVVWGLFRNFKRHLRIEAFEITLWFSRYFDRELWDVLEAPRSHAGYVVREHLPAWDDPRLAGFLLLALRREHWRRLAARTLAGWSTFEECRALLQHTELLEHPDTARQISLIKSPPWFGVWQQHWRQLSALEQCQVPRWMSIARLDDEVRVRLLEPQLFAEEPRIRRAALYALARVPTQSATRLLSRIAAAGADGPAHYASWVLLGRQGNLVREAPAHSKLPHPDEGPAARVTLEAHQHEFSIFWQMLRRQAMTPEQGIFHELHENLADWHGPLRRQLRAPDPRDRVMALRLIEAADIGGAFRDELATMLDDSAPGVRGLAVRMLKQHLLGAATEGAA